MSAAACHMWRQAPNLQTPRTSKLFPVEAASRCNRSVVIRASYRPISESPEQALLRLQTSSTAANTAEQQESSLATSSPASREVPGIIRNDDVLVKRRVTLARLIKGVYELEFRRLQGISFEKSPPARSCWESVHFDLVDEFALDLVEQQPDKNIDLVVYKWNSSASAAAGFPAPACPKVVIAIRGTLPSVEDGWHNLAGSLQRLHLTPRYRQILKVVKRAVEAHGSDEICIAGHSLGAALGLIVARTLATEEGTQIECHLFNPVYAYSWIPPSDELSDNEGLWRAMRALRCATIAGLANVFIDDASRAKIENEFVQLQDWTPHLYINTGDPICRGYWEYFTNHERLARNGVLGAYFAHLAAPFSGRGLLTTSLGSKPWHLIPSAVLYVCEGKVPAWYGTNLNDRSRYSGHSLGTWITEDLPVHTREVRLSSW